MQLTKLEIKGFKSFGDKITINFNEGVTAIVGPNGCGKSNVVDAIRWVLGEQSTRMLRSEKMENIIFNGTKNRKPSNLAEVSLTFDNTKNILPTEFSTVTLTRKLYRNGDSEYRLNDVKCRLKDITDLFLDTGVGADTYSIIELKMIDEIIANKENSRRNLFEEASGISKYKVRKKQTLAKLKDTESDLSRVDDLLFEISKNLKNLENQAKKAERYFKIKEEYKSVSIGLAQHKLTDFGQQLEHLSAQEDTQKDALLQSQTSISAKENELQTLKRNILTKEVNLAEQQKTTQAYINKIRAYESDKKIKNEQMRHLQEKESRLNNELSQDKQQLNHALYTLKRLKEELHEEQTKQDALQADLDKEKAELEALRSQQQSSRLQLDLTVKQDSDLKNKLYQIEKDIAVLRIQRDALEQESARNIHDSIEKESELDQFNLAVATLEERVITEQQHYEYSLSTEKELQAQISRSEEILQETSMELNKESRLIDARQNEYNLTKSMVDNLEGFPESIRFLRKNAGWKKSYPLFSDVLFCKEDYRVAIENYLEPFMNHYVIDTQEQAVRAIKLLNDGSRGRANFFILDAVNQYDVPVAPSTDDRLLPALEIIAVEEKYKKLCEHLLHNVYLLKFDDEDSMTSPLPDSNLIILQRDGKFTKNRLGISGGSVGLFEGKRIGRAKNLESLAKEIKTLKQRIDTLQLTHTNEKEKLSLLKSSSQRELIDELRTKLNRAQNELVTVKTKQEQYQSFILNSRNRKQDIDDKIKQINVNLAGSEPQLAILKSEIETSQSVLQQIQRNYDDIAEIVLERSTFFNQENIRFHQQQNKVSGIGKDIEYREHQHDSLATRIEKNAAEYEKVTEEMKAAIQHVDHNDGDLIDMYEQKESLEQGLQEMEEDFYKDRKIMTDLEEAIGNLRRSKELTDVLISELKDKKTTLQINLNTLKERLAVEFGIDIRDLIESDTASSDLSQIDLQQRSDKLKRQLDEYGTINHLAKEAYDEIIQRHDFIVKEKDDLLAAKSSLMSTIHEIDQTANDKFMAAFTHVRENFVKVFRSLFNEEDSCDLVLSNPTSPLESDIDIIAQPKGKRPLSINQLSGGEKTLTSTALLFSLYLLKPAPFCIFDEVDAPLDDTNIDKFNNIIREFSNESQFIVVSHNKRTIASTDIIYGVTMVEQGVSRVVAVDLRDVA